MNRQPLKCVVVNCGSGNGWSQARSIAVLNNAADLPGVDLIFGCELGNVTRDDLLDPNTWDWVHDPSSSAKAGTLLAWRKSRVKMRWHAYRVGCPGGYGIQRRYLIVAQLAVDTNTVNPYTVKVVAGHAPPKRAWALWPTFMLSARSRNADILGADWNKLAPAVEKALDRATRMGGGIVGLAHRRTLTSTPAASFNVGSDHDAIVSQIS